MSSFKCCFSEPVLMFVRTALEKNNNSKMNIVEQDRTWEELVECTGCTCCKEEQVSAVSSSSWNLGLHLPHWYQHALYHLSVVCEKKFRHGG